MTEKAGLTSANKQLVMRLCMCVCARTCIIIISVYYTEIANV